MRVPLIEGSYSTRSVIASAQRCINLYAEANPKSALSPFTFYSVPGLTSLAFPPTAGLGRGLYWANSDALYYVCGSNVYGVSSTWNMTLLGTLTTTNGIVSMVDNGTTLILVDGSPNGYQIDLATNAMTPINAANNSPPSTSTFAFYGADRVDMLDGFTVLNQPGTQNFYSSYDNEPVFDALYFAAKNGYSDNLVTIIVTRREIWLIGERTTEIWFDAGNANFPFAIMPGPFVQHGCIAKYSVAQVNGAVFWLAQDQTGRTQIVRGEGYAVKIISTVAMEYEFQTYAAVSDAEAFCFSMGGHAFYQITFPTANRTWRWDERTPDLWHEALWTDSNGNENRHRASCAAWAYGVNVCADWQTGQLYAFDLTNFTDAGQPMTFRRGYPHMMKDGHRVIYPGFTLDIEAATSLDSPNPVGPFLLMQDFGIVTVPGPGGLQSDGGVLILTNPSLWPSTNEANEFYSNGGVVAIEPPFEYDPLAAPVYFGRITAIELLALGASGLPPSDPGVATQLWNMNGQVTISSGAIQPPAALPTNPNALNYLQQPIDAGQVADSLLVGPTPPSPITQPLVFLRWSDDRGRTWSNPVPQTLGATGKYLTQPAWKRCGMGRDRVFEIYGTMPGRIAVNGAFLEPPPIVLES